MKGTRAQPAVAQRCWVEIDLQALQANVARFRAWVGARVQVIPAVKANGYGHGIVPVACALLDAGAQRLAVASVQEGAALRQGGVQAAIHLLGPTMREEIDAILGYDLIPSLCDEESHRLLSREALRRSRAVRVHLKIDTGMGRHGWLPDDLTCFAPQLARCPGVVVEGAYTHLAQAGDEAFTRAQLARFDAVCATLLHAGVRLTLRHAANSTAAVLYREAHYDAIRPGLGIYGITESAAARARLPLQPALAWKTRVAALKDYPAGHAIGYNRTFVTARPTRAAFLPVGYADGYRRGLSNRADVLVRGQRCRVLGMVSMDCTMIDVSLVRDVAPGDLATLVGTDGTQSIAVEELAALLPSTIPYELITSLGSRNQWVFQQPLKLPEAA